MAQFPSQLEDERLCDNCRRFVDKRKRATLVSENDLSRASNRSLAMDESTTELDFHQRGADDRSLEEETPTTGRPPLGDVLASGSYPSSPRRVMSSSTPSQMSSSATTTHQPIAYAITPSATAMTSSAPVMTSFRDLASGSPMTSSAYSLGGRSEVADIPEEDEDSHVERRQSRGEISMSKFIRLDREEPKDIQKEYLERKRSREGPKQIFPMFIGLADNDMDRPADVPRSGRIIMT
ncbi:BTB domain-containing protein, partial [Trichostrongylus colubriformis]